MEDETDNQQESQWLTIDLDGGQAKTETVTEKEDAPAPKPETQDDVPEGDRVQRRINTLTRKRKEAETQAELLANRVRDLETQLAQKGKVTADREASALNTYKSGIEAKLAAAQKKFSDAYDAGDKAALSEANLEIANLTWELNAIRMAPKREEEEEAPVQKSVPKAPKAPELPDATKDWLDKNPWFGMDAGKDRVATQAAIAVSDGLIEEGFDPSSEEFYTEIEKRLVEELPRAKKLFGGEKPVKKEVKSPVAGQTRRPTTSPNSVTLTPEHQVMAKRLGVTNEEYAFQMKQVQDEGYTPIVVGAGRKK
jgi:hypothetical protein